jgi:hypothetical protein
MSWLTNNYGYWEFWAPYDPANGYYGNQKCIFDGQNKLIYISPDVDSISVKQDLYSNWKEWVQVRDNSKFVPAIRVTGGDPVGSGKYAGDIYFLINGWQIVIDHLVSVEGTLYHDDPISPYIIQSGGGVIATVSNLSYSTDVPAQGLTPLQQIELDKILKAVRTAIALSA